jgi:hypothetical protein
MHGTYQNALPPFLIRATTKPTRRPIMTSQDTNVVSITGTVGREIKPHFAEKGHPFLTFQVGVHRAGRRGRLTTWLPCVAWGPLGEMLKKRLTPGAWLYASGAIESPPPVGSGLPEGHCALELVVSRAVLLGVRCPCSEDGACGCEGESEDLDARALAEEAGRGNPLPFDILSPEDQALVDAFWNANGLTPVERTNLDAIAASFQKATEDMVGGTAEPDGIPYVTPDAEVRDVLLQARDWKAKMEAKDGPLA